LLATEFSKKKTGQHELILTVVQKAGSEVEGNMKIE
jgi:hypothetical protein